MQLSEIIAFSASLLAAVALGARIGSRTAIYGTRRHIDPSTGDLVSTPSTMSRVASVAAHIPGLRRMVSGVKVSKGDPSVERWPDGSETKDPDARQ